MSAFKFHLDQSGSSDKSCNVISFRDILIMIDCKLDLTSALTFLPLSITHNQHLSSLPNWIEPDDQVRSSFTYKQARILSYEIKECQSGCHCVDASPEFALSSTNSVDPALIDVVLISNYQNMLGLPYLTERMGFNGNIYLTEPTFHFGRILMEEMIRLIERTPKPKRHNLWKQVYEKVKFCLPRSHAMINDPNKWLPLFSRNELSSCLSKLKIVSFSQSIDIYGLFEVSAHSSGFCIGSSNWLLKSNHEKIVYMAQTSLLTSHPKPLDTIPLQEPDILILTNLANYPLTNPDASLGEFCSHTIQTVKNEGNVLVPCYPCGLIYDLIECIAGQLTAANLSHVPIYFISPVADESLAYSNILGEWLTLSKQTKVFIPEEPFIHGSLVRAGRLRVFNSVSHPAFNEAYKTPCVLFASHPSLRFGDVVHFIQLWGKSSKNLLVMTEPDFPCTEAISPFLPLAMKVLFIPIDTNWNLKQANDLIHKDLRPKQLVQNKAAIDYQESSQTNSDLTLGTFERMDIDPQLAGMILQSEIRPGLCFATVNGSLVARDNKLTLQQIDSKVINSLDPFSGKRLPPVTYYYGNINLPVLMELLARSGISDATIEGAKNGKIIELRSIKSVIHLEDFQTHIITADLETRRRLRSLVVSCLRKF